MKKKGTSWLGKEEGVNEEGGSGEEKEEGKTLGRGGRE